jgi:dihydroorotate dehydrogenase (NAD+) catalytic subunit
MSDSQAENPEGLNRPKLHPITIGGNGKAPLVLPYPVMNAAGTFGYGDVFERLYRVDLLGAVVTNPTSWSHRSPAKNSRVFSKDGGALIHSGMPNPGLLRVIKDYDNFWAMLSAPVIMHIISKNVDEIRRMCGKLEETSSIQAIEFGIDDETGWSDAAEWVRTVVRAYDKPVLVRIPFSTSIDVARAVVDSGADAIVCAAPPTGIEGDPRSGALTRGRLYGAQVKPLVLRMVDLLRRRFEKLTVIGCGGINSSSDARDYINVGANGVQLDAAMWVKPKLLEIIAKDLAGYVFTRETDALPDEWSETLSLTTQSKKAATDKDDGS